MLDRKILKFVFAGVINTGVDWGLYFILVKLIGQHEITAKVVGALGGITSAFILNALWVFRDSFIQEYCVQRKIGARIRFICLKYLAMVAAYAAGMLVNVAIFSCGLYFQVPELVALVIATAFSFILNFMLSKKYVFQIIKAGINQT